MVLCYTQPADTDNAFTFEMHDKNLNYTKLVHIFSFFFYFMSVRILMKR